MDWIDIVFNGSVAALRYCASTLRMSYQEINVWLFCVAWPLVTVLMMGVIVKQWGGRRHLIPNGYSIVSSEGSGTDAVSSYL